MGSVFGKVHSESSPMTSNLMAQKRKCRDILCIPLFLVYCAGMGFVFYISYLYGEPARLIFATDYAGNICGSASTQDSSRTEICYNESVCGKYITYPKLDEDLYSAQLSGFMANPLDLLTYPFHGVCRSNCPEGNEDLNLDGEVDNWVCNYDEMNSLIEQFGPNEVNPEIPSRQARIALEECLLEKEKVPFMIGLAALPREKLLSFGDIVDCFELMSGCWKMHNPEKSIFFRCVPAVTENSTCISSPYLEFLNQSVSMIIKDNSYERRPASDPLCGECLEPKKDVNGNPMNPSSPLCKASIIRSAVEITSSQSNPVLEAVDTWTSVLQSWLGDVYNSAPHILISAVLLPFILGLVWLIFLRVAAKTFVFTILYGLLLFLVFLSIQFLIYGEVITADILSGFLDKINNATGLSIDSTSLSNSIVSVNVFETEANSQTETYKILGWTLVAITIIYLLLLMSLYRRIKIAVALIKEATIAVGSMPLLLLFPIITVSATVALSAYWVFTCLYIVSMGELETLNVTDIETVVRQNSTEAIVLAKLVEEIIGTDEADFDVNMTGRSLLKVQSDVIQDTVQNLTGVAVDALKNVPYIELFFIYHLLGYYWANELIQAIGATTVAGAVGSWYWSTSEEGKKYKNLPRNPIIRSFYRVFRYHIGSLIFGSLIIALIQLARKILMYIDNRTKNLQKKNSIIRILMKVIQCCLCILEYVLKFITKHAYIFIALFGKSFCQATQAVFKLLVSNFVRIGTATAVSNLIIFLGRVLIVSVSTFVCSTLLAVPTESKIGELLSMISLSKEMQDVGSIIPPILVAAILSWFVSGCFMNIYGLAIDTILISLCVDEEKNDGSEEKPFYMTKSLKKLTKKWNKKKVHAAEGNKLPVSSEESESK